MIVHVLSAWEGRLVQAKSKFAYTWLKKRKEVPDRNFGVSHAHTHPASLNTNSDWLIRYIKRIWLVNGPLVVAVVEVKSL